MLRKTAFFIQNTLTETEKFPLCAQKPLALFSDAAGCESVLQAFLSMSNAEQALLRGPGLQNRGNPAAEQSCEDFLTVFDVGFIPLLHEAAGAANPAL